VFLPQRWLATHRVPPILFFIFTISGVWVPLEFVGSGLGLGYGRALLITELIIPLFVGVFLYVALRWIRSVRYEHFLMAGTVFLLMSSSLTAGLLLHEARLQSSPWVESGNSYIVESELNGWDWYFESKSADDGTLTLGRRPDRFVDLHLTARERVRRSDNIRYAAGERRTTVPPHFGNTTLGAQFGDAYYIDTAAVRLNRLKVHPEWDVFVREDFNRLQMDLTANRVYQNGNVNIYRVTNGTGN